MKKLFYILIILALFSETPVSAQSKFGQRKNVARESLSGDDQRRRDTSQKDPFDPGGGGEGDPIPINGGVFILIGLSLSYFFLNRNKIGNFNLLQRK